MNKLFDLISKAWKAFVLSRRILPLFVLVDLLFIYSLTRLHYEVFNRASSYAQQLIAILGEQVQEITQVPDLSVLQSPAFTEAYRQLLKYIGIFFGIALLIWIVGKGIVWLYSHKAVGKVDLKKFALKFILMTIIWFIAFILLTFLILVLLDYALYGILPILGQSGANFLGLLIYWILGYFVFISYSLIPKPAFKQAFVQGAKHWRELLPVHFVNTLIFFVALTVPASLVKVNIYASLAFVVFISLPGLAFTRILWTTAVKALK